MEYGEITKSVVIIAYYIFGDVLNFKFFSENNYKIRRLDPMIIIHICTHFLFANVIRNFTLQEGREI